MPALDPIATWRRGVLDVCVLGALAEQDRYGYDLTRRLAEAGLGTVTGSTLYPLLKTLERDGLVTTQWREGEHGPGRKYYALTPAGRTALSDRATAWTAFSRSVTALTRPPKEP